MATRRVDRLATAAGRPIRPIAAGGDASLSHGPLGGTISPAFMREVERCLFGSLGITA